MGHVGNRGPRIPLRRPLMASNWTLYQTGTNGSLIDIPRGLYLSGTSRGVGNDRIIAAVAGGGTGIWTATAGFIGEYSLNVTNTVAGMVVYESSTGKSAEFDYFSNNLGQQLVVMQSSTSLTGASTSIEGSEAAYAQMVGTSMHWLRIAQDSTNLQFWMSGNGLSFELIKTITKTTPFTTAPDKLGIMINPFNNACGMRLFHWSVT